MAKILHALWLLALPVTQSAEAQLQSRWRIAVETMTQSIEIDTSSIVKTGDRRIAWVQTRYFGKRDPIASRIATNKTSFVFDCTMRTSDITQDIDYDSTGAVIASRRIGAPNAQSVVPESIGEIILTAVCSNRWRKTMGEALEASSDSIRLEMWQLYVRTTCPEKKVPPSVVAQAFRRSSAKAQKDSAEERSLILCKGN